jgi:hypothetical protein
MRATAEDVSALIGADSVAPARESVPAGANVLVLVREPGRFTAELLGPTGPVRFVLDVEGARRIVVKPDYARFRFQGLP